MNVESDSIESRVLIGGSQGGAAAHARRDQEQNYRVKFRGKGSPGLQEYSSALIHNHDKIIIRQINKIQKLSNHMAAEFGPGLMLTPVQQPVFFLLE